MAMDRHRSWTEPSKVEVVEPIRVLTMERGIVSAGRDAATGQNHYPALELVRRTIPRRVYTQAHMDLTAESVAAVHDARRKAKGLRMVYEPRYLRFFQARFEPLE
jgi:tyrosine phenol-lyase